MSALTEFFKAAISPVTELIDDMHTSDEERLHAQAVIREMEIGVLTRLIELESQQQKLEHELMKANTKTIQAEANGESWLQRNWRPILMLTFGGIIVARVLGLTSDLVSDEEYIELFALLKIGIGGYVVGRSAEKGIKEYTKHKNQISIDENNAKIEMEKQKLQLQVSEIIKTMNKK